MSVFKSAIVASAVAGASCLGMAAGVSAAPTANVAGQSHSVEGDWQGIFGRNPIRFRFEIKDGSWRGWFVSQKDGSLYPLEKVTMSGTGVSFTQPSKPNLDFVLKLAPDGETLTGVANWPDGAATAQSFKRM